MDDLLDQEAKLALKLQRLLVEHDLESLLTGTEVEEAIDDFKGVIEVFESVHVGLQRGLGEDYLKSFPTTDVTLKPFREWLLQAKRRSADLRRAEREEQATNLEKVISHVSRLTQRDAESQGRWEIEREEKKNHLRNAWKRLTDRVRADLASIATVNSEYLNDINRDIAHVRQLLKEVCDLDQNLETVFGNDYAQEFGDVTGCRTLLNDAIRQLMDKGQHIQANEMRVKAQIERNKEHLEQQARDRNNQEKISIFNKIFENIRERHDAFHKKYSVSLDILPDDEVLKRHSSISSVDTEFNEFLDLLTDLVKARPLIYQNAEGILHQAEMTKENFKTVRAAYLASLTREVDDRDLTERKLKNASSMNVDIPKFKDYSSVHDFYTFKSDFEKFVAPHFQSKLLPDQLKSKYLEGQALLIVKEINDLDEIWKRLEEAFGNVDVLLANKLRRIVSSTPLFKIKDDVKLVKSITELANVMIDLSNLAEKHDVETTLYHPSNLAKIYDIIGNKRQEAIIKKLLEANYTANDKASWEVIVAYLKKEVKVKEQVVLFRKAQNSDGLSGNHSHLTHGSDGVVKCVLCSKDNHVPTVLANGNKVVHYFSCDLFVGMSAKGRFDMLRESKLCLQCLYPGRERNHVGKCFTNWNCPHASHKRFPRGLHVLVCERHKDNPENVALLEAYKSHFITFPNSPYRDFSKNMALTCFFEDEVDDDPDMAMYILQTIKIGDYLYNLFYDTGCKSSISEKEATDTLVSEGRAEQTLKGPLTLYGVNNQKSVCEHGKFKITLPLHNGKEARIHGICVDKITETMPTYPLTRINNDLNSAWKAARRKGSLPGLPEFVGGDTHIMLGVLYYKWFPVEVFRLPNGLSIYRSKFSNQDGTTGVVGGPHPVVTEVHRNLGGNHAMTAAYFSDVVKVYRDGCRIEPDIAFLSRDEVVCETDDSVDEAFVAKRAPRNLEKFDDAENAGTDLNYRCVNCRGCRNCLKSSNIECVSVQEEMEQEMIEKSVTVDLVANRSTAYLPFLSDPDLKLAPNDYMARRIYKNVTRSLRGKDAEKEAIRKADKKLQDMGFVDYLDNLPDEVKQMINSSPVKHYLAWRIAWNANSISTPARPVYDGSLLTSSGYCLNDLVAKGTNNMNKLLLIFLRWRVRAFAYHTDLQTMYNRVGLAPEHWCYQLYFWDDSLDPDVEPRTKVFKTVTYGITSSGNQASVAIRKAADMQKVEYPRESEVIHDDTYVDDCFSGEDTDDDRNSVTDGLIVVLEKAGFNLKGFTFSGCDPPEHLTKTGTSITVAGTVWHSRPDLLSLNIPSLNFGKKRKGRKLAEHLDNVVPDNFTRRHCATRVGEVFDLIGRFTPITAGFKLDLNTLCRLGLDWDDPVPSDLQGVWKENFQTISELGNLRYQRVIIPEDAVNLEMETLEMADASESLACAAVYIRIRRKDGSFHCQLMFARSKILPQDMDIPRCELLAAELNATTGHIVKLALGDHIVKRFSLTDSQITLYWICNSQLRLKKWPRNRVIEIRRLTDYRDWFHVEGKHMTADLGTRKGVRTSDISEGSKWVDGEVWTRGEVSQFPIKSVDQLSLSKTELNSHSNELLKADVVDTDWIHKQLNETFTKAYPVFTKYSEDRIKQRYSSSSYIIDPLKYRFRKVVRILALVLLFTRNLRVSVAHRKGLPEPKAMYETEIDLPDQFKFINDRRLITNDSNKFPFTCAKGLVVELTERHLKSALVYYFRKATIEVKSFRNKGSYENISEQRDGILFYSGRILPSQKVDNKSHLSDVCIDLSMSSFCVPLVDKYSPLAYAIVNEVHWYDFDVFHSGNETVLRNVSKIAHIFGGRSVVCDFRADCPRCHFLEKKRIRVAMGPLSDDHLCVAPAFYNSQVDLCGPFKAYSSANKRATVKVWFSVFVCCTTGAVDLKVLEDYSTKSFVLAFTRFSCKVGYPRKLLPDAGSQLVKGCESTTLVFSDVQSQLHEVGVTFEVAPVGAHYMHGKVERKIRHVKESFDKHLQGSRLSVIDWETLGDQIANAINNLPIGLRNICRDLENIDLITPNRLLLARNNSRSPAGTLQLSSDLSRLIEQNDNVFKVWFQAWLVSYCPNLMFQPKWFHSDKDLKVGDVVLFLKSEKEFEKLYQYGMISEVKVGRDGKIRTVFVEYQNTDEKTKRRVSRGAREIVVIHPVGELGLVRELNRIANSLTP